MAPSSVDRWLNRGCSTDPDPTAAKNFDIHKDPDRFIRVMAGYALMSDKELGINTYIKKDNDGKYVMFKGEEEIRETKLYLENRPIAFQRAIVCRGTTCYRAKRQRSKRWEFVVKFSWRSDKRRAEGDLLRLAKQSVCLLHKNIAFIVKIMFTF